MDKSAITLERTRSFVRVAERGSFSTVAREHGVGQATITRHITELEGALGVTLLSRTTRRVTLTAEGTDYLDNARTILRLVDEAADDARSAGDRLEDGRLGRSRIFPAARTSKHTVPHGNRRSRLKPSTHPCPAGSMDLVLVDDTDSVVKPANLHPRYRACGNPCGDASRCVAADAKDGARKGAG